MNKALLALSLALAACGSSIPPPTIEQTTFAPSLGVSLASSVKTADGMYYRDIPVGTGALVAAGQTINVKYKGSFPNGATFDENNFGFAFVLDANPLQVIKGFNEGVRGMMVGGSRQLIIPPALAYGEAGTNGIPGNSILVFTVQVVSAQ